MKLVAFTLSMPGCPSWDGKWSGEGRKYAIVRRVENDAASIIAAKGHYSYLWQDGWCAGIDARIVGHKEAAKLRKESDGFAGYDWMVDTIISHGVPMAPHEMPIVGGAS